jgi:putative transposase
VPSSPGDEPHPNSVTGDADVEVLFTLDSETLKERLEARFQADVERLCGPKGRPDPNRTATRHDYRVHYIKLDGQELQLRVPRVRTNDGKAREVPSFGPLYEADQRRRAEEKRAHAKAVVRTIVKAGVSTRNFREVYADLAGDRAAARGLGKSALSDILTTEGRATLEELNARRFDDVNLAAVMLDGTAVGGRTVLVAIGYAEDGTKLILGTAEDQFETEDLVAGLLRDLVKRGADLSNVLFTVDDGEQLRSGIKAVCGENAQIQNCIVHVTRAVEGKDMPKLLFRGVDKPLHKALTNQNRNQGLTAAKRLANELEEHGYAEAAEYLRQQATTIAQLRLGNPNRAQMTEVIEATERRIEQLVPRDLWIGVKGRLYAGWDDPNYPRALKRLEEEAQRLEADGYPNAAKSLRKRLVETLVVTKLGVTNPAVRDVVRTSNPLESLNGIIEAAEKRHHHPWASPPSDERERWVAMVLDFAVDNFTHVQHPEGLREMTLNVLKARHPDVDLDASLYPSGLVISSISVEPDARGQGKANAALADLLGWANRRGITVGVTPRALETGVDTQRLSNWFESYGFAPNADRRVLVGSPMTRAPGPKVERVVAARAAEIEESPRWTADPLDPYRHRIGELLGARIGTRAIALAPQIAAQPDEELARQEQVVRSRLEQAPLLRDRISEWLEKHGEGAARVVAIARGQAKRDGIAAEGQPTPSPLDRYRRVLGESAIARIEARASELEAALDGRDDAVLRSWRDRLGDPFEPLAAQANAWMADKAELAAMFVALRREITAREEMAMTAELVTRQPTGPPLERLEVSDRLTEACLCLGKEREKLLREHAASFVAQLDRADTAFLVAWRARLGDPFTALDREGALQTLRLERDQRLALAERDSQAEHAERLHRRAGTTKGPHQGRVRAQSAEEATANRTTAQQASARLDELTRQTRHLRDQGRHLDTWMSKHGDRAARVAAVDFELTVRRELDRALRAEQTATQEHEAAPREVAPQSPDVAVEIEPVDHAGLGR